MSFFLKYFVAVLIGMWDLLAILGEVEFSVKISIALPESAGKKFTPCQLWHPKNSLSFF